MLIAFRRCARAATPLVACCTLLASCAVASPRPGLPQAPTFENGFQVFPTPRTFDGPGTIFRIDPNGVRHAVADLSSMLRITPQDEVIPSITVRSAFDAGAFLSWLGQRSEVGQLQRVDSAVVAVHGAKRERAFEVQLRRVVDSAAHLIDWSRPGKVYLIAETILADSVDIDLSSTIVAAIGDTLRADSARARGITVNWHPSTSTHLDMKFPRPYRVFYKADQLARRSGFENDSLPVLMRIPVTGALVWRSLR